MDKDLLDALAARAEQRALARTEIGRFEIGGQMLDCKKLTPAQQLEYYSAMSESGGAADMIAVCVSLIYDSCPALQDPELHRMLGIADPYDAVRRLMDVRELDQLGGKLFRWNGLLSDADGGPKAEELAKNS